jgi:hypothetical protein
MAHPFVQAHDDERAAFEEGAVPGVVVALLRAARALDSVNAENDDQRVASSAWRPSAPTSCCTTKRPALWTVRFCVQFPSGAPLKSSPGRRTGPVHAAPANGP